MSILEVKELTKRYTKSGPAVLGNVSITLEAGKIVGLLGPNGSGKTTLIKIICGLLTCSEGQVLVEGKAPGRETKKIVAYLPDTSYLSDWMRVDQVLEFFTDFYADFDKARALKMLSLLQIDPKSRLKSLSKGTKEKVQLILVMSRDAKLYVLDEPIGGVDPAARDYILKTIITNYSPDATVLIATHLIADIESVLDEVIFVNQGVVVLQDTVDHIREERGQSVDEMFREVFAAC
ncbi:MAG: ABC transporter ATP-binding protein [Coriobacteriia bacterium]|nr:ABC transporter ATP-binding protein [Coriobacteriia bacterium]